MNTSNKNKKSAGPAYGAIAVITITVFTLLFRSYLMSLEGSAKPHWKRSWDFPPDDE